VTEPGPVGCPTCGAGALPVWWSAFEPEPAYPAYEDASAQILLAPATHACSACGWYGAPGHGSDEIIETVADLLIAERLRTLDDVARVLSRPGVPVSLAPKEAGPDDARPGLEVGLADGGTSLEFPFLHWRLRRTVEVMLDVRAGDSSG
jgi:hypothetical protein